MVSVVAYMNHLGGTQSPQCVVDKARELWECGAFSAIWFLERVTNQNIILCVCVCVYRPRCNRSYVLIFFNKISFKFSFCEPKFFNELFGLDFVSFNETVWWNT